MLNEVKKYHLTCDVCRCAGVTLEIENVNSASLPLHIERNFGWKRFFDKYGHLYFKCPKCAEKDIMSDIEDKK